jgi:cell division transport system permease protein
VSSGIPATLRRGAPLVPTDSASGRSLAAVIAILTFLAALCASGAELVATSSAEWRASAAREATIQVRPTAGRDTEADIARAVELARASPGISEVRPFSKDDSERLLEPWLGSGLDLGGIPVPRLIVLRLAPEGQGRPDMQALRARLAETVPGASLDDHKIWMARLSTMAGTVVSIGVGLAILVLVATGLAVAFATRGAMAGNREVVDVLHFVGANDAFIAREFQRRFFRLGLRGGIAGAGAALALILLLGEVARLWQASPAGDQLQALFGTFDIGWGGALSIIVIGGLVSVVTAVVSRVTVRRYLGGSV